MATYARELAEPIANHLELKNDPFAIEHVRRNLKALIAGAMMMVERSPDVVAAAQDVEHEVKVFLDRPRGPMGILDQGPGAEAQRQRAVQAAKRFETALEAAAPSDRARALGVG